MTPRRAWHPIIGDGYFPINDDELEEELAGAKITERTDMFGTFTVIAGYRNKVHSADGKTAQPFLCIMNHTPGHPHLFTSRD
nr:hypothetical protein [Herbaspirillum sp. ASV7]